MKKEKTQKELYSKPNDQLTDQKIHAALAPAPQLKTMPRMRSNCLTISEKQTNHAQQKFGSLQEFSLQGMILSLFA